MNMAFTLYKVMSMIRRDPVWPAARRAARWYAGSRMGARARVGLPPEGARGRSGLCQWALASGLGGFSWWLEFLEAVAVHHYY